MSYAGTGGVRIAYDDEGPRADDAVVFLGAWCIRGRLADRHRVIRLDWRGHGDLFSQPRAPEFLAGQQNFSAANPWFSVNRLDGVTHFPALEIPDATAAEIENFLG